MITTLWYAIWIIQDIMQGFITVNWQVFYRKKDKMAGVKNKPWQWNTGIHFSFFFFWDYCCWNVRLSFIMSTKDQTQSTNFQVECFAVRVFILLELCQQHFRCCTNCINLCSTYLELWSWNSLGFFLILTPPPLKKKQHPTTKEFILSNLSFIIDFLCCINWSYLYTLIN